MVGRLVQISDQPSGRGPFRCKRFRRYIDPKTSQVQKLRAESDESRDRGLLAAIHSQKLLPMKHARWIRKRHQLDLVLVPLMPGPNIDSLGSLSEMTAGNCDAHALLLDRKAIGVWAYLPERPTQRWPRMLRLPVGLIAMGNTD